MSYQERLERELIDEETNRALDLHKVRQAIARRLGNLQIRKIDFPLDCLPPRIEEFVRAYMTTFKVPADHYALAILTAAGAAIGNAARIDDRGTYHPAVLYGCLVDVPGSGKTPTINTVLRPFRKLEEEARQSHALAVAIAKEDAKEEGKKGVIPRLPPPVEYLVGDFTLEALVDTLEANPRGAMAWSDEIEGFLSAMDKYRNGKGGDGPFWLSAFTGETYKNNRRNRERPVYLPRVFCPFLGGIQPGLLSRFGDDSRDSSGFLARVLFTIPPLQPKQHYHNRRPDRMHQEHWEAVIRKIVKVQPKSITRELEASEFHVPHEVPMSDGAKTAYEGFFNGLADQVNNLEAGDEVKRSTLVKFETHCLRFALILHFLEWASKQPVPETHETSTMWMAPGAITTEEIAKTPISLETMQRAVTISEYFMATGLEVVGRLIGPLQMLPEAQRIWYEELPADDIRTAEAVSAAAEANISERTVTRLLANKDLFAKQKRGVYERLIF